MANLHLDCGEWIRVLCNDYLLTTLIEYTDYFEVIVTLDPITEYPPTTNLSEC